MEKQKLSVAKVQDKINSYLKTGKTTCTNMLDPVEIIEAKSIIGKIEHIVSGGFDGAERKVIFIGDNEITFDDFITIIHIISQEKLTHRNVLGSILGLGIKRDVIGDILIKENECDVVVMKEISKFILQNLEKVGREKVTVAEKKISEIMHVEENKKELNVSVSSLRLDNILSAGFGTSREESAELIRHERVLVDYQTITNISKQIKEGSLISVRGHGRLKLVSANGETKSGRIKITLNKW